MIEPLTANSEVSVGAVPAIAKSSKPMTGSNANWFRETKGYRVILYRLERSIHLLADQFFRQSTLTSASPECS
jgi:hypothetical protein